MASFEGKVRRVLQAQVVAAAAAAASRSYHYDTHWVNTFNDRKYFHFELVFFIIDPKFTELEFAKVYWVYLKTVWEAIALNRLINKVCKISSAFNPFSIAYFINCHLQFTFQFNHTAISSLFQFVSRCKDDTQIVPGAAATSIDTDNWDTGRVLFGAAIRI